MSIPTAMPVQVTTQTTEVYQMGYTSPQGSPPQYQQGQPMNGQLQYQQQYVNGQLQLQPQQQMQQPQQQYMNGQQLQYAPQQQQQQQQYVNGQQYVVNGQIQPIMQQPQQQQQYVNGQPQYQQQPIMMNGQMQPPQQQQPYQIPYGQQPQQQQYVNGQPQQMQPYQQQQMQPYQQQQPIPQQQVVSPVQQLSTGISQAASSLFGMMSSVTMIQPQPQPVPVTTNSTCPKCTGHGWVHDSNMTHDKDKHSKCFFCTECKTCNGKGILTTTTTSCHPHGHSHGPQTCPKCTGHGWTHDSSMKHDKDKNSKCFFCSNCKTCNGKGIL